MKYIVEKRTIIVTRLEITAFDEKEALRKGLIEEGQFIQELTEGTPKVRIIREILPE